MKIIKVAMPKPNKKFPGKNIVIITSKIKSKNNIISFIVFGFIL
jgi:hypothetical protein